jgi:hypothetical protein
MCIKRSKDCYGYREEADLRFRDQTESTRRKLGQKSKVDRGKDPSTPPTSTNQSPYELSALARTGTLHKASSDSLLSGPPNTTEAHSISGIQLDIACSEQSLSLFFHQYVAEGHDQIPGMNEFLPHFYQQSQPHSCLKYCVAATAYASLANQSKSKAVGLKAWESYGTALSSVNAALADPVESLKDETLCALFILGIFENISGQHLHIFGVHGVGMDRLLHFRGLERLASTNGQQISKAVCAYLQIRNLTLRRRPPPHEEDWLRALSYRYPAPYRQFMLRVSRICHARADADNLLTKIDKPTSDDRDMSLQKHCSALTDLIAKMQAIDTNHWPSSQNTSGSWDFVSINRPNSGIALRTESDSPVHIYPNLWIANFWNWNRSTCILLQCSLLTCLEKLSSISEKLPNHDSLEANAQMTIKTMIQDICASIPFVMCDVDGKGKAVNGPQTAAPVGQNMAQLWLLWHFHIVLRSGHVSPQQMKIIRDAIPRIGHGKGIRQALLGGVTA